VLIVTWLGTEWPEVSQLWQHLLLIMMMVLLMLGGGVPWGDCGGRLHWLASLPQGLEQFIMTLLLCTDGGLRTSGEGGLPPSELENDAVHAIRKLEIDRGASLCTHENAHTNTNTHTNTPGASLTGLMQSVDTAAACAPGWLHCVHCLRR